MKKAVLEVKVIPNANKDSIAGWENGMLKIRLNAPPEKGKANKRLVNFLSNLLGVSQQSIHILSGETSRKKRVAIEGISEELVKSKIGDYLRL